MNIHRWNELKIRINRLNDLVNELDKEIQNKSDEKYNYIKSANAKNKGDD